MVYIFIKATMSHSSVLCLELAYAKKAAVPCSSILEHYTCAKCDTVIPFSRGCLCQYEIFSEHNIFSAHMM